jgi:serine/threonine-protein kinase
MARKDRSVAMKNKGKSVARPAGKGGKSVAHAPPKAPPPPPAPAAPGPPPPPPAPAAPGPPPPPSPGAAGPPTAEPAPQAQQEKAQQDQAQQDQADSALIAALLESVLLPQQQRMLPQGEIGQGGMGVVSALLDRALQRRTAQKTLIAGLRAQPMLVRAFIREAQITAQLDHPNIVPVHDIGLDEEQRLFFTMKHVQGRTLAALLEEAADENRFIDDAYERLLNLLEIVVKVCDALAFAHSRGVLHCDIKAQNVMVGDYGQVYLMDWGFARLLPRKEGQSPLRVEDTLPRLPEGTDSGFVFGTPGYMSPEQAQGLVDQLDERSDVFSIGALLYQVLTGEVPYRGKTPVDTILLAQRAQYAPLDDMRAIAPSLRPRELVRIITRAMAPRKEDRYPNIEALRADLVHFLRGGSNFPSRMVPAGTHIIREGEVADAAYILMSGQCEVYRMVGDQRVTLQVLKPGEVFGEMALLASSPRIASVVARTDVHLVVVTRQVVEDELNSMKPWMGAFIRALASRFREQQELRLQQSVPPRAPDFVLSVDEAGGEGEARGEAGGPGQGQEETGQGPRRWWRFWE